MINSRKTKPLGVISLLMISAGLIACSPAERVISETEKIDQCAKEHQRDKLNLAQCLLDPISDQGERMVEMNNMAKLLLVGGQEDAALTMAQRMLVETEVIEEEGLLAWRLWDVAMLYVQLGEYDAADQVLQRVPEKYAEFRRSAVVKWLADNNQVDRAKQLSVSLNKLYGQSEKYSAIARAHIRSGDVNAAMRSVNAAAPSLRSSIFRDVITELSLAGRPEQAERLLIRSNIKSDVHRDSALASLAAAYIAANNTTKANQTIAKLKTSKKHYAMAPLARAYSEKSRFADALVFARRIESENFRAGELISLSLAMHEQGSDDLAIETLRSAIPTVLTLEDESFRRFRAGQIGGVIGAIGDEALIEEVVTAFAGGDYKNAVLGKVAISLSNNLEFKMAQNYITRIDNEIEKSGVQAVYTADLVKDGQNAEASKAAREINFLPKRALATFMATTGLTEMTVRER